MSSRRSWIRFPLAIALAGPVSIVLGWQIPGLTGVPQDGAAEAPPRLAYVSGEELVLRSLPVEAGAPPLGALLGGTAVRVHEQRAGWTRISVQGWVPAGGLSEQRPAPGGSSAVPPARPVEPVLGLDRAGLIHVEARAVRKDGKEVLELELRFATRAGRPVIVSDGELEGPLHFELTILEERRVAGGRIRGDVLLRRTLEAPDGSLSVLIGLDELPARPPLARVLVRTTLPDERQLFGSVHDVGLKVD